MSARFPSGIMCTCCVPWDDSGRLVEGAFRRSIQRVLSQTSLVYVFGTAGEGYAVTETQFDDVASIFAEEVRAARGEPMIGVIHLSAGTILERVARCRDRGIRRFQISLPSWGAVSEREMFAFFERICGSFADCQFMHYNLPRTKRIVSGAEYGRLAAAHENLVATKNCGDSLSHIQSLLVNAPQLQHFLSETGYAYGCLHGECSMLASFTTNWPKLKKLFDAGRHWDVATLAAIQREVNLLMQTLLAVVPGDRIDGAYDKLFEKMYDPEYSLRLAPPYIGSSDDEFNEFVQRLRDVLPDWVPSVS